MAAAFQALSEEVSLGSLFTIDRVDAVACNLHFSL
ncbi:uncharacterized protein VDAG_01388 [Verticillium dahliae VdLs.17]|uniref:Uncharacterized protein n=1 Tax=Verticillium dahliae (strain VdLs.17 / ATCC MYA-4575 / FGSC 10137) TaxID=498257 RepID=G2WUB5_VERDV|nr:uncharacterized protein VDAG_01388 [Verticillium dahliae VdLs.17]EGY17706.1 hypothetical protein VDAG_01388 [Verticillium dahliae VdLs.17]